MAAMPHAVYLKTVLAPLAAVQQIGDSMLEGLESRAGPEYDDRHSGGWHAVLSAWAFVVLLVMLFAGTQALACYHAATPRHAKLAGAVIPRHNSASAGVGIPCSAPLDECGKAAVALVPGTPYPYPVW
jgi:hypothetical protein